MGGGEQREVPPQGLGDPITCTASRQPRGSLKRAWTCLAGCLCLTHHAISMYLPGTPSDSWCHRGTFTECVSVPAPPQSGLPTWSHHPLPRLHSLVQLDAGWPVSGSPPRLFPSFTPHFSCPVMSRVDFPSPRPGPAMLPVGLWRAVGTSHLWKHDLRKPPVSVQTLRCPRRKPVRPPTGRAL